MSFTVRVQGDQAVRRALRRYMNPELRKRLQAATKAGAKEFVGPMRSEAAGVSRRLARSVSAHAAKRDKPASIVTFRPKVAFFRHFVIGGTKDHGPRKAPLIVFMGRDGSLVRAKRVRGVRPNPIPQRVAERMHKAAADAVVASLTKE